MVQAATLGNGDYLASSRTLDRAPLRAIFGEGDVCPGSMVAVHVGRENTPQVSLVEDDWVTQAFSADRADDALDVRILPGGPRCVDDLLKTPPLGRAHGICGHTQRPGPAAGSEGRGPTERPQLLGGKP
jgi:hypothetical protein